MCKDSSTMSTETHSRSRVDTSAHQTQTPMAPSKQFWTHLRAKIRVERKRPAEIPSREPSLRTSSSICLAQVEAHHSRMSSHCPEDPLQALVRVRPYEPVKNARRRKRSFRPSKSLLNWHSFQPTPLKLEISIITIKISRR